VTGFHEKSAHPIEFLMLFIVLPYEFFYDKSGIPGLPNKDFPAMPGDEIQYRFSCRIRYIGLSE